VINILNSLYVIRMVARTIHITEAQAVWLDDNAYNTSKYVRKILTKIINKEIFVDSKIATKTN
jgi:hypothetical protein